MLFILPKNLFSFWKNLDFCSNFSGQVGKQSDNKAKVNFKIYDVKDWVKSSYNIYIALISQEVKAIRLSHSVS